MGPFEPFRGLLCGCGFTSENLLPISYANISDSCIKDNSILGRPAGGEGNFRFFKAAFSLVATRGHYLLSRFKDVAKKLNISKVWKNYGYRYCFLN